MGVLTISGLARMQPKPQKSNEAANIKRCFHDVGPIAFCCCSMASSKRRLMLIVVVIVVGVVPSRPPTFEKCRMVLLPRLVTAVAALTPTQKLKLKACLMPLTFDG